ncbi:SCO6745 family protein [Streptomyces sp. NBC_00151]|uniref:SCO6745 family protein n=1 Tax=Streptomyces sp. NBC_00151 TaxID=2975669 RepID=UPI002DDC7A2A|nr:MarR family transcriptional regulator [Streptomyces sp. NBC_00151]WRZ37013.1 MarR family transcriptional regulator [Streptomyces sp. NBC_00151]
MSMRISTPSRGAVARDLWRLLEPIHAVVYFAPEPLEEFRAVGYRGFWMGYFAGRAAPLGSAGADIVHALFYNFAYERVSRAVPAAWSFAPPNEALQARVRGSVRALGRALGPAADGADVARAAELATRAAQSAPLEGRALFAANRSLPVPQEPLARLWQAATLLREHRGDGHVAALVAAGIAGRESHVLHATSSGIPRDVYTPARDFDEAEWTSRRDSLKQRGLIEDDQLSRRGHRLKARIEERTDQLAATAYDTLTISETDELARLLRPLTHAVVREGDIPLDNAMGLNLRESLDQP